MCFKSLSFPLADVAIKFVDQVSHISDPLFLKYGIQLNQHSFRMDVKGVGSFYACNGNKIEVATEPGATCASVSLYLEGSVYGAILHQRKIMPLHGSCFVFGDQGIMLCGDSGAGKSSLTALFCQNSAEFLSDDVSPLIMLEGAPHIIPCSKRLKLMEDCLQQMGSETEHLTAVSPDETKYYFPVQPSERSFYPLHRLFIIEIKDQAEVSFTPLRGVESFVYLRNEIYRWEYLSAMPIAEAAYLQQLIDMSDQVIVTRVVRPKDIPIREMYQLLKQHLTLENIS